MVGVFFFLFRQVFSISRRRLGGFAHARESNVLSEVNYEATSEDISEDISEATSGATSEATCEVTHSRSSSFVGTHLVRVEGLPGT